MINSDFSKSLVKLEECLIHFARSLTSNTCDAKDLVQDTFLKALGHKGHFENEICLKVWAFTIMRNTFINNYRQKVRRSSVIVAMEDYTIINTRVDRETPESSFSNNEINRHIDMLEPGFRIPFLLHTQGYKYKEIANGLNLKEGTVKSRIFFTRRKLMESLSGYGV